MNVEYQISEFRQRSLQTIVSYNINEYWETFVEITEDNQGLCPDCLIGDIITVQHRNLLQEMGAEFNCYLHLDKVINHIRNIASNYGVLIN